MKPADVIRQAYDELRAATGFVHGAGTWLEEARRYFEREERSTRRDPRCARRKYRLSIPVTAKWMVLSWVFGSSSSRATRVSDIIYCSRGQLCAQAVFEVLESAGKLPSKEGVIAEALRFRYDKDVLLGGH